MDDSRTKTFMKEKNNKMMQRRVKANTFKMFNKYVFISIISQL